MVTTSQIAKELGIQQRAVQNRIMRLGLKIGRVGNAFVLTASQAQKVREYVDVTGREQPADRLQKGSK